MTHRDWQRTAARVRHFAGKFDARPALCQCPQHVAGDQRATRARLGWAHFKRRNSSSALGCLSVCLSVCLSTFLSTPPSVPVRQ